MADRRRALEELRAKRSKASPAPSVTTSNGSSSQAADRAASRPLATSQSMSTSQPKVLVPDSSPSASPIASVYKPHPGHGVPLKKPGGVPPARNAGDDLMVASNFLSVGGSALSSAMNGLINQPLSRSSSSKDVKSSGDVNDRPRKRLNTGASTSADAPIVIPSSPAPSIAVSTPPRRPVVSTSTSHESTPQIVDARQQLAGVRLQSSAPPEDDDDLPDPLDLLNDAPAKRKLVRGRLGDAPPREVITVMSSPEQPPAPASNISALREIAPEATDEQLYFMLRDMNGDMEAAKTRLREQREILKANKARREAAAKSRVSSVPPSPVAIKGNKKSAIYAKRLNVAKTAGPSQSSTQRPSTPNQKRKRPNGNSDAESGADSDSFMGKGKGKSVSDSDESDEDEDDAILIAQQNEAVGWFDAASESELMELTSCSLLQAKNIVSMRPFLSHQDLRTKFNKKGCKVSYKTFESYMSLLAGYRSLDKLLKDCKKLGDEVNAVLSKWAGIGEASAGPSTVPSRSASTGPGEGNPPDAGIHLTQVELDKERLSNDPDLKNYLTEQPSLIAEGVVLKDYQMLGLNWLNLLYSKKMSCILADEMGLGKTIQIISFFAHLKATNPNADYRHLVVVPPSTLENWVREFERFAPEVEVQTYYGSQQERAELRDQLMRTNWDVLITTYNFAHGNEFDRKFFKRNNWRALIFDEGHMLKSFQSQRYQQLIKINATWKVLLTGTPVQNNLQELASLLNFLMPGLFREHTESLRAIFRVKSNNQTSLLSRDRISRAKQMMTPFILRRRKDQVLKDLPKKTERIEWCDMTATQKKIYREAMQRSKAMIQNVPPGDESQAASASTQKPAKPKRKSKIGAASGDTSSNVLMDLRKAASHPMLFRRLFDDAKIQLMAKHCLMEPDFCESRYDYVVEDMEVMTDSELQYFCKKYKSVNKHALADDCYLAAGKIDKLLSLLKEYREQGKRVLIFSQFVQILNILEAIFASRDIKYLMLTGSTAVDERQGLVDEFTEDESIPVFLLSTRAGGMGINLTAACVVIIFDQDFNPHNDKQACDRAYRIGQKRDVEIVKLITKGTIEEDIYRIGNTKIMLDDAVAGDAAEDAGGETATEKKMKSSLLNTLRTQFLQDEGDSPKEEVGEQDAKGDVPHVNGKAPGGEKLGVEEDGDVVMVDAAPKPSDVEVGLSPQTAIVV